MPPLLFYKVYDTCAMQLKKSLGQHFLQDESVLQKISNAIGDTNQFGTVVEIGPGAGALTKYLIQHKPDNFFAIELDDKWAIHLQNMYPILRNGKLIHRSVLDVDFSSFNAPVHVVGNFPYNISSQIVFKVLENAGHVTQLTGMFQKEVAQRIAAKPGKKDYGVLSVLAQFYYDCEYLFDIAPEAFNPPPKVMSGVVRMTLKNEIAEVNEQNFRLVVKTAFNQRRKTLKNSLSSLQARDFFLPEKYAALRPEQLSLDDFIYLAKLIK